jgi:hypothetical protein
MVLRREGWAYLGKLACWIVFEDRFVLHGFEAVVASCRADPLIHRFFYFGDRNFLQSCMKQSMLNGYSIYIYTYVQKIRDCADCAKWAMSTTTDQYGYSLQVKNIWMPPPLKLVSMFVGNPGYGCMKSLLHVFFDESLEWKCLIAMNNGWT